MAQVRNTGFLAERYEAETASGCLDARGRMFSGDLTLSRDGQAIAWLERKLSFGEKFAVDIANGENPALILAILLAVEAIHDERTKR